MLIIISSKKLISSIWSLDWTLTGTTTNGQNGSKSNSNEGVLHMTQIAGLEPHHRMKFNIIPKTLNSFKFQHSFKYWYVIWIIQFKINHLFSQLNGFKYTKWLNSSIWPIDGTLTGTIILGQSGIGSNEGILHIPQSSRTRASTSDDQSHILDTRQRGGLTHLQRCCRHILPLLPMWLIKQGNQTKLTILCLRNSAQVDPI